jgi:peptidoglycan/LPS O-acetylase OafA/YrhL
VIRERRTDIQVLRGLSVIAVILFHSFEDSFPTGYLGVDAFFVISGFVITPLVIEIFLAEVSTRRRLSNLKKFLIRRFYRLAPALGVTLALAAIAMFLLGPVSDHSRFARQGIATLLLAGNLGAYKYNGDYFQPNPNPLVHTWSLSVEVQIYLIIPLFLFAILTKQTKVLKIIYLSYAFLASISIITFLQPRIYLAFFNLVGIENLYDFQFYSPISRMWEFCIGGMCWMFLKKMNREGFNIYPALNYSLIFLFLLSLFSPLRIDNYLSTLFVTVLTICLLAFHSLSSLPSTMTGIFAKLGNASYSIYLVHLPLIYLAKYSPVFRSKGENERTVQIVLAVLLSIILGYLNYLLVENRFRVPRHNERGLVDLKSISLFVMIPLLIFYVTDKNAIGASRIDDRVPIPNVVLPWDWDKKCAFLSPNPDINQTPCLYGDSSASQSILLIGDSHAASASKALIRVGELNGVKVWIFTFMGCSFMKTDEIFNYDTRYPNFSSECNQHNKRIFDFVKKEKPSVIVYAHASSSKFVVPNDRTSRDKYNELILENLYKLRQSASRIILVGSVNEYIPRETYFELLSGQSGRWSRIPFDDNDFWQKRVGIEFKYLDTLNIFCPKGICENKAGKDWLFHDVGGHLSKFGADLLIPSLSSLIKSSLNSEY